MPYEYRTVRKKDEDGNTYTVRVRVWVPPKPKVPKKKRRSNRRPKSRLRTRPSPGAANASAEVARRKREAAARAAAQRKRLYDLIKKRQRALMQRQKGVRPPKPADSYAEALERAERRRELQDATTDRARKMNEAMNANEARRLALLKRVQASGDFERELRRVEQEQKDTGGRYLDKKTYGVLFDAYRQRLAQVQNGYEVQQQRLREIVGGTAYDGLASGTGEGLKELTPEVISKARALMDSKDFKAAMRLFAQVFGTGVQAGEAARVSALLQSISRRNDEYITRVLLQMNPTDEAKADVAREEIENRLYRRGPGRPSATPQREGNDRDERFVRLSINDYLDEVEEGRRRQEEDYLTAARKRRNILEFEGFDPNTGRDLVRDRYAERVKTALRAAGFDADAVLRDLRSGDSVDSKRALEKIRDAMREQLRFEAIDTEGLSREQWARKSLESGSQQLRALDEEIFRNLLGQDAPSALELGVGDLLRTPVIHEAATGLGLTTGGIFSLVRLAQHMLGGRVVAPDLQFSELWEGRNPLRLGEGRSTEEERAHEQKAWDDLLRLGQSGDIFKVLEGIAAYGSEPFQGNVANFLGPAILDPLNVVGPARYLARARLASRELGGFSALVRSGDAGVFARRFNEFLKDTGKFRSAKLLDEFNTRHGTTFKSLSQVDELAVEAERLDLLKHPEKVTEVKGLERLWKGRPEPDSRQLVVSVAHALEDYLAARPGAGRVVRDIQVQKMLRRADTLVYKGERRLRGRAESLTAHKDLMAGERALAAARVQLGRKGAKPVAPLKGQRKRAYEQHLRKYQQVENDFRAAIADTKRAADVLRDPLADVVARRDAFRELEQFLAEGERFLDVPTGTDPRAFKPGLLRQADVTLNKSLGRLSLPFLGARLVGPKPRAVALARDIKDVDGLIALTRKDLAAALPADKAKFRDQLRELGAARRQLERHRHRAEGQQAVADEVVRRHAKEAEDAVPIKRVAARVKDAAGAEQEMNRDLHTLYHSADIDKKSASLLDPAQQTFTAGLHNRLSTVKVVVQADLVPYARAFQDLNLWQALQLAIITDDLPTSVIQEIARQARNAFPHLSDYAGRPLFQTMRSVIETADLMSRVHVAFDDIRLDDYLDMDRLVVRQFRARDRKVRHGALDFRTRRRQDGSFVLRGMSDAVEDAADVIRAIEGHGSGLDVFGYRQLQAVFRNATLRNYSTKGLVKRVDARVAKGESFDDAWADELQKLVTYEATNDLERFAMNPVFEGRTSSEIWEMFEDLNLENDLVSTRPVVSQWAYDTLEQELGRRAKVPVHPIDNRHSPAWMRGSGRNFMRRALGGVVEPPPGARLPTADELDAGLAGLNSVVPVFVVPDNSPHLSTAGGGAYAIHADSFGIIVGESNAAAPAVVLHELGHSLMTGNLKNDPAARQIRASSAVILNQVGPSFGNIIGWTPPSLEELIVELYGRWASGPRPLGQTLLGVHIPLPTWDEIQRASLAIDPALASEFANLETQFQLLIHRTAEEYGVDVSHIPPFWDRPRLYEWLVENGYWRKRTGDAIRKGSRVWSVEEEREFFFSRFAYEPVWTDEAVLAEVLDDPIKHDDFWATHGVLDNGFEVKAAQAHLDSKELKDVQAFGDEAHGIHRRRSADEQRRWFVERYGPGLMGTEGKLLRAPWLMDPNKEEFVNWVTRRTDKEVPQTLVRGAEREAFVGAVAEATRRYVERAHKAGTLDAEDVFLPEEAMRLTLDVVDELMYTKAWRSKWTLDGRVRQGAYTFGELQKLSVVFSIPFVVVNLLERFTFRPFILGIRHPRELGAAVALKIDKAFAERIAEAVPSLSSVNIRMRGLWEVRTAGGWQRAKLFGLRDRRGMAELARAVKDSPFSVSSVGEDTLKLGFARGVYATVFDDLVKGGAADTLAHAIAMREARRLSLLNFPSLEDAGELEKALNQLVPFLSYNFNTAKLYIGTAINHPALFITAQRLGAIIEQENREAWAELHGDTPFPEEGARTLNLRIGEFEYAIDLSMFSDILRAGGRLTGEKAPTNAWEWFRRLIRIPHPIQEGAWALLMGEEGPWGPVQWTDFFWPAEFWGDLQKFQAGDLDAVEFISQSLFWQRFRKLDPAQQGAQWYFALGRAGRYDEAEQFLQDNPLVATYLIEQGVRPVRTRPDGSISLSWFVGKSAEQAEAWRSALAELRGIQSAFDARLKDFYDQPWSDEYKLWKKLRRASVETFLLEHPELTSAFALSRTWQEWQAELGEWVIDDLFEQFELLQAQMKPVRANFPDELAWRIAQREYNAWRQAWLEAHPLVAERLASFANDVEAAWREQEATWGAKLDYANELKIRILEEELKGEAKDREVIDLLYDLSEMNWQALDAEAYVSVYEDFDKNIGKDGLLDDIGLTIANLVDRVPTLVDLPGFTRTQFDRMTDTQKAEFLEKQKKAQEGKRYGEAIQALVKKAKSGAEFVRLLRKDPWLWAQYQARNPEKARYLIGIGDIIARARSGKEFFDLLRQDPWLWQQYMARHPEKQAGVRAGSEYFRLISRWGKLVQAEKFDAADAYWKTLPAWVKERYFSKHPEKRAKAARNSAYMAAMERWVSLAKANKHAEADRFFRNLPTWMRERYFQKHPDARFRLATDQRLMAKAAEFFAADAANRPALLAGDAELRRFLRRFETNVDTRRALIMTAYRLLTDPWLKRVYRERYPEYFSKAAQGQRRLEGVARDLAENPELLDRYKKALALQTQTFVAQFRRSGVAPKPLTRENAKKLRKRRHEQRRRAARFTRRGGL